MAYQVMWTDPAIEDLREIVLYLSKYDHQAAERFGNSILGKVELLSTQPYMGAGFPTLADAARRQILVNPYRIFYRVREEIRRVEILHVRHSARHDDS